MKEIPAAKGHWLFGHAMALSKDPLQMPADIANRHGGAVQFRVLHRPFLAITDPVLARHILQKNPDNYPRSFHYESGSITIGHGLLTVEDERWRRSRKMMQPVFRIDPVREVAAVTARSLERCGAGLAESRWLKDVPWIWSRSVSGSRWM